MQKTNSQGFGDSERSKRRKKLPGGKNTLYTYFQQLYDANEEPKRHSTESTITSYKWSKRNLAQHLATLKNITEVDNEKKTSNRIATDLTKIHAARLLMKAVYEGGYKQQSARKIAESMFDCKEAAALYRGRRIIGWVNQIITTGDLKQSKKGAHKKTASFIEDKDILRKCVQHLRSDYKRDDDQSPFTFFQWINNELLPPLTSRRITERTALRWMHLCNFHKTDASKGIFHDGHEAPDVIVERHAYLEQMAKWERYMPVFSGVDLEIITEPSDKWCQKRIILCSQDESTCYANDAKRWVWLKEGMTTMRKEDPGQSVMISGIICPCHGIMEHNGELSYEMFEAGTHREGWWTAEDVVKQVIKVIRIFEALHADAMGLFQFDSSSNHHAMARDALVASRLNLKDGGNVPLLRDTFIYGRLQKMQLADGTQKGIRRILQERNKWIPNLRLKCPGHCEGREPTCCARRLLSNEPDFQNEKTMVQKAVEARGHLFINSPRFHCELQFIEQFWGSSKRYTRANCEYNISALRKIIPSAMKVTSISTIRRYYTRCMRFMDAYRQDLNTQLAHYVTKKYKSHRRLVNVQIDTGLEEQEMLFKRYR